MKSNQAMYATALLLALAITAAAETRKEFHYTVGNGATLSIVNPHGNVVVKTANGRVITINTVSQSDKVEVDSRQNANRVDARTHNLQKATGGEARVDYEISVPADTSVSIDAGEGQIKVENLRSNVTIESEAGGIDVNGVSNGAVHIETVGGNVNLNEIQQARVQVTSTGGGIQMNDVTGPMVTAKSTSGTIRYTGDFSGGGTYTLVNHSGDIEVSLPSNASVELAARSVKGTVENDFPFQKNDHPGFVPRAGKSFAGTANSAASSVELRSFSGKIRVKKQ